MKYMKDKLINPVFNVVQSYVLYFFRQLQYSWVQFTKQHNQERQAAVKTLIILCQLIKIILYFK